MEKHLKVSGISLITNFQSEVVLGARKGRYGITKETVKSQIGVKSGYYGTLNH